jgi:SAM-dependent methyltransferase
MSRLYESVAESIPQPELLFLNYGFWQPGLDDSWITPSDTRYRHHLNLVKRVLAGIDLGGKAVLEIGCGRGGNCYYLSHYCQTRQVVGVDVCVSNLALARQDRRLQGVGLLAGDAQHLPFADASFDVVLNLESSHCYRQFLQFLSEVTRVLRRPGLFCFADLWNVDFLELDWPARECALENCSLEIVAEEDISEQVFQAIGMGDGIWQQLNACRTAENRPLITRINKGGKALRAGLAAGEYAYRLWRLRKSQVSP